MINFKTTDEIQLEEENSFTGMLPNELVSELLKFISWDDVCNTLEPCQAFNRFNCVSLESNKDILRAYQAWVAETMQIPVEELEAADVQYVIGSPK